LAIVDSHAPECARWLAYSFCSNGKEVQR
jgi:hypothetical protein